jgi:uncharacterized protein (DUF2164 family)
MFAFTRAERQAMVEELRDELREAFDLQVGELAAELLLDKLVELIGPQIYNRALADAQTVLARRLDDIAEAIVSLEKRIPARR